MDQPDLVEDDFKFKTPFGLILSGASGSGKSTLQMKFLERCDELMDRKPDSILYIYHTPQSMFNQFKDKAQFYNGWDHPDLQLHNLLNKKNIYKSSRVKFVKVSEKSQHFLQYMRLCRWFGCWFGCIVALL